MKSESIAYVVAGICFGIILGWVIGTQQARRAGPAVATPTASSRPASGGTVQQQAPTLDEGSVQALNTILQSDPKNVDATIRLANLYFDAERWNDAIKWYGRALELDPKNADASTDLGVSYYYSNKPDEALAQFERSLAISPTHTKTLLNKGIVLAFGKQDLKAAATEWQKVVELAPDSPEGQAARRALDGIASAHGKTGSTAGTP
jgi:cytochrome c-type biogenesis protein CcmH/NrfG